MITDYFGKELCIGDPIIYLGTLGRSPVYKKGKVVDIDERKKYGVTVQVLGDKFSNPGWTYPERCINLKYVEFKDNAGLVR